MRRLRAAVAAVSAAVILLLGGCSFQWALPGWQQPDPPASPTDTDYSAEYAGRRCYRSLSPRMQQMYAAVYSAMRECHTDTWISIRSADGSTDYIGLKVQLPVAMTSSSEARLLFNALTNDNPQFFYIGNTYSYEGYRLDDIDYYDIFCLTLTMPYAERQAAADVLEQTIAELLAAVPENAGAYEKELLLHDMLAARVTYDTETAASPAPAQRRPSAFTAYGALVEGRAVCEGYARAMQILLDRVGIGCTLVSGTATGGASHMWDLVEIDGRGYHLDVTWDDVDDLTHHTFFNLTTEEILLSHTIDEDNLGVDTCTATAANYYRRENRCLDTYDRSLIAEAVAWQVTDGADTVELQFSENTFANAQLFFANARRVRQYVEPFLGGEAMWNYTCQVNDIYRTLILCREEQK